MNQFWSPSVNALTPYIAGEQSVGSGVTKVNVNESSFGPAPMVLAALRSAATDGLRLYPVPASGEVRSTLDAGHDLKVDECALSALHFPVLPSVRTLSLHAMRISRLLSWQAVNANPPFSYAISVRHFDQPCFDKHLRITVGRDEDCSILIMALPEIANNASRFNDSLFRPAFRMPGSWRITGSCSCQPSSRFIHCHAAVVLLPSRAGE